MISLAHYLGLSAVLFALGLAGLVIHRRHLIQLLMCIELLLLAVNTQFIALSDYLDHLSAQIMVFFYFDSGCCRDCCCVSHSGGIVPRPRYHCRGRPQSVEGLI